MHVIEGDNQRGKRLPMAGGTLGPTMILSQNRISGSSRENFEVILQKIS
ncbi:MAG: hypothetical protein WCF01_00650 [Nitrososphaeraceae archaeon]